MTPREAWKYAEKHLDMNAIAHALIRDPGGVIVCIAPAAPPSISDFGPVVFDGPAMAVERFVFSLRHTDLSRRMYGVYGKPRDGDTWGIVYGPWPKGKGPFDR